MIANQAGTAVWRWDQGEPFGNDVPNNNPSGAGAFDFPLRFPGQYFDRETNLAYNYFRDCYDPALGRYCQSDPVGLSDGPSTYAYVRSNPLIGIDLRGLTTYRGFDPQKENEMRLAVDEAKDKIRNCPNCPPPSCQSPNPGAEDCFPDDDLKRKLIDKLDKATFVYDPDPTVCGRVTFLGWFFNRVNVSDLAFGPRCCKLSSKLAHEAYHLILGIYDPVPYKLEAKCFGCPGPQQ